MPWPSSQRSSITGDETGVYGYNPETKQQSSQWKSPFFTSMTEEGQADSFECQEHADVFYTDGLIPCRFDSQSVDKYFKNGVLLCLQEIIWLNCPGKWHADDWMLQHNNASPHTALSVHYWARNKMAMVLHSLYFLDLAHSYLFLFPRLKIKLKDRKFNDILESQQKLRHYNRWQEFQKCLQQWKNHWNCCSWDKYKKSTWNITSAQYQFFSAWMELFSKILQSWQATDSDMNILQ